MTDDVKRAGALLDVRGVRVALCASGAVAIWCVFAVCFVHGLWRQERPAPLRKPVAFDVKLVRLPPPPPPPPPAQAAPAAEPRARNAQSSRAVPPQPQAATRSTQRSVSAAVRSAAATNTPPPDVAHHDSPIPAAPAAVTQPSPPTSTQPAAQTSSADSTSNPAAADQANAAHATPGAAGAPSGGNGAAHAIIQPLPSLPDDLRADAFQAVATARFTIHRDGSVDVELIKPTHNPRLNQLLLDALQKWRFFPAMKNGAAVESSQDIRVHFNVD